MKSTYQFPTEMSLSRREVERECWRCSYTRAPDLAFHFSIVIPRAWRPVDVPANAPSPEEPFTPIALFRTREEPRGEIEVSAALLSREVAPGDWLDYRLEASDHEVLHRRDTDTEGGLVSDVLTRTIADEEPVISRWLAVKDGKHLFVVEARATEADYAGFAGVFFMAVTGFELLHQGNWPLAESLKTFTRRDPGDFLILYPESWHLVEDPSSNPNALVLQLNNVVGTTTLGKITFAAVARSAEADPHRLAANYVEELAHGGVPIQPLRLSHAPRVDGFEATWQASGLARGPGGAAEVRVVVGKRPDAWFLLGLLGPDRKTAADIWAVNRRAFEIVLTYLRTPESRKGVA